MGARQLSPSEIRGVFVAGTVMHNPITGEYARVVEHTGERAVGELLAVGAAPWPGRTSIPVRRSGSRS
jgi:hypothetical protein